MQKQPKIIFRNVDQSDAIEAQIRQRIDDLGKRYDRMIGCEVIIEAPQRRKSSGRLFKVHLSVQVPGQNVEVTRQINRGDAANDINFAVNTAFSTAGRQLTQRKRQLAGH